MFHYWKTLLATHLPQNTQKGQDLGEYALLFALIALAVSELSLYWAAT